MHKLLKRIAVPATAAAILGAGLVTASPAQAVEESRSWGAYNCGSTQILTQSKTRGNTYHQAKYNGSWRNAYWPGTGAFVSHLWNPGVTNAQAIVISVNGPGTGNIQLARVGCDW